MLINSISDFRKAVRHGPYAWPGGYPCYFVLADGEALSFGAVKGNIREIVDAIAHPMPRNDWQVIGFEINWEDTDLICAHTGERIESAYGD
jgi:hypothetical protein